MSAIQDSRVEALLDSVVDLHTLPVIILEAERLMRDPRTSAQQVADLLGRDPALAGRILRLVNSPFYGFQRRIGNLTQAIVILGFQTVKNLMLTVSVIESFEGRAGDEFDYPRFWAHSVATAITAAEIARAARTPLADEAYIGGLLHDAGKLMIAQHIPELSATVAAQVLEGQDECEAEREVLGLDHTELGARLATAWSFPESLVEAIRHHHSPRRDSDTASPADVIHLADLLTHGLGLAFEPWVLPPVADGLSQRLGYDETILSEWIARVVRQLTQASDFFEVVGAGSLHPLQS